jgi:hypothetical protein
MRFLLNTLIWICVLIGVIVPVAALALWAFRGEETAFYFEHAGDFGKLPDAERAKLDQQLGTMIDLDRAARGQGTRVRVEGKSKGGAK